MHASCHVRPSPGLSRPIFNHIWNKTRSLVVPIARYQGWIGRAWRSNVVQVMERHGATTRRQLLPFAGVIDYAREGGVPAELFGAYCDINLCSESWEFVLVAVHYEMVRAVPDVGVAIFYVPRRRICSRDTELEGREQNHPRAGPPSILHTTHCGAR